MKSGTTRSEDIAYSLFRIFDLHLSVLYGKLAENLLGRLLAEIVSRSGDVSALDWVGEVSLLHSYFPARITSYQGLLPSSPDSNVEEQSSTMGQEVISFKALQRLHGSLAVSAIPRSSRYAAMGRTACYSGLTRDWGRLIGTELDRMPRCCTCKSQVQNPGIPFEAI
ncbi:hypothetical protein EDC04DRAFT_2729019 [Pisolithus marmoratus]|nr:hypothetical protein EDC04DRAFT_2729019 [Pisolithus marmoratus]